MLKRISLIVFMFTSLSLVGILSGCSNTHPEPTRSYLTPLPTMTVMSTPNPLIVKAVLDIYYALPTPEADGTSHYTEKIVEISSGAIENAEILIRVIAQ